MKDPFGLYIHIPYCLSKCPYCDFNSYACSVIPEEEYTAALLAEFDYRVSSAPWRDRPVRTVYFGGGTPSLFSSAAIGRIIGVIEQTLPLEEDAEITLEANPCSLSAEAAQAFLDVGVNRLSIGVQSFNARSLIVLGRSHTADQSHAAIVGARAAGCHNLSIDIMYDLPGQRLVDLQADLQQLSSYQPEHVSVYGLTIEAGTPFYEAYRLKQLKHSPEDLVLAMVEEVNHRLAEFGYCRYEISNFSRPRYEARHNMAYWSGTDYLGLGAGAHSCCFFREGDRFMGGRRWENLSVPHDYQKKAIADGQVEKQSEELKLPDLMFEYFFLGLRKLEGVSIRQFEQRFGLSMNSGYGLLLEVLATEGLLQLGGDRIALTERGLLLADNVIANFANPEIDKGQLEQLSQDYNVVQHAGVSAEV